jgi:hypothetical protein
MHALVEAICDWWCSRDEIKSRIKIKKKMRDWQIAGNVGDKIAGQGGRRIAG